MLWTVVPFGLAVVVIGLSPRLLPSRGWRVRHPRVALGLWGVCVGGGGALLAASLLAALIQASLASAATPVMTGVVVTAVAWAGLGGVGGLCALASSRLEAVSGAVRELDLRLLLLAGSASYRRIWLGNVEVNFIDTGDEVFAVALRSSGPRILVTRAVAESLTPLQLRALLEHERSHLRHHHDLVLKLAMLNAQCFPMLPGTRALEQDVRLLIELVADDDAARAIGVAAAAEALDVLADIESNTGMSLRAARLRRYARPVTAASAATPLPEQSIG